ncbi:MAG TPA: O-antigen ligase family protein [Polyangia bacterium]|nr:O-antigen ligase family protein [Polyangia bacterium]
MLLKGLLFFNLLYTVNELHFRFLSTGIPAVAPVNILFLLILWAMKDKPEALGPEVDGILRKPLFIWYGMITLGLVIGELRSFDHFLEDVTYFKNALFYPLYYLLYLRCRQDEKTTRWLIIWIMVIAAVAGLEGLREGLDYGFGRFRAEKRASGPFGADWREANRAGVFYAMFMPMFISLALFLRKRLLWRLAAVGGCILLAGGIISTYSRQAYLIVVLALALLLIRKSVLLAALVAVMAGTLVSFLPDAATQRVEETSQENNKAHNDVDTSTASRWEIWQAGMGIVKDHPLGAGIHKFSREIGNYTSQYKGYDAHNFYVLTLCENGPQCLLAFLFVIYTLFRVAAFVRNELPRDDPEARALGYGFTVTTLCMAVGGLYGSPTFDGAVMGPYWALCGLLERYTHLRVASARGGVSGAQPPPAPSLVERFPLAAHILPGKARL